MDGATTVPTPITPVSEEPRYFWSGSEIASTTFPEIGFLVDRIVPKVGIVLLYGKFGSYKTPLTVHLAHCVATGQPFFDLPTQKAKVLYLEADTPQLGLWPRLQAMNLATPDLDFAFMYPGFDILDPLREGRSSNMKAKLLHQHNTHHYGLIIVDSLRTMHRMPGRDDEIPSAVYAGFSDLFFGTTILFVHHDRKTKVPDGRFRGRISATNEPDEELDNESFSGSQAWLDRATVGLKLRKGYSTEREWVSLAQSKSQVGPMIDPLQIHVTDGCHFTLVKELTDGDITNATLKIGPWKSKQDLDAKIATVCNVPERLARIARIRYESTVAPIHYYPPKPTNVVPLVKKPSPERRNP